MGVLVVVGAMLQAAVFTDPFTAEVFFVVGVLCMQAAHALMTRVTDLRTVGNGALLVGIVCAIYAYLFATGGGVKPDGKTFIGVTPYFQYKLVAGFSSSDLLLVILMVPGCRIDVRRYDPIAKQAG